MQTWASSVPNRRSMMKDRQQVKFTSVDQMEFSRASQDQTEDIWKMTWRRHLELEVFPWTHSESNRRRKCQRWDWKSYQRQSDLFHPEWRQKCWKSVWLFHGKSVRRSDAGREGGIESVDWGIRILHPWRTSQRQIINLGFIMEALRKLNVSSSYRLRMREESQISQRAFRGFTAAPN